MRYLSACSIVKNELDLEEFICYHRIVGIEHFTFYDNDSVIPVKNILKNYIDTGIVNVIDFPGLSRQMPAYNHYLENFGKNTQWAAMIDADEFLVPKQSDSVLDVLDNFANYASLQVNWILFGSSGHLTRPEGLVIENYTQSSPASYKENLHTKAIVQPAKIHYAGSNPHYFVPRPGFRAVGEDFEVIHNAWSQKHNAQQLQLNHYTTKSLEDFEIKMAKGRADAVHLPGTQMVNFDTLNNFCTEQDKNIVRFIEPIKRLMHPNSV